MCQPISGRVRILYNLYSHPEGRARWTIEGEAIQDLNFYIGRSLLWLSDYPERNPERNPERSRREVESRIRDEIITRQ